MLPTKNRLKLPASWRKARPDQQFYSPFFKVIIKKIPENKSVKIGFILSSKVGKATIRNRTRRRLTSFIEKHLEQLEPTLEIVFLVSPLASEADNEVLSFEVNKILSKIPLLRSGSSS